MSSAFDDSDLELPTLRHEPDAAPDDAERPKTRVLQDVETSHTRLSLPATPLDETPVPRGRARDPARFSLEIVSDGRSFHLPAPVGWVMAGCVVLIALLASFDPGRAGLAVVERQASRVAAWEAIERARQRALLDGTEEPLRALRRAALERGLVPEGALAPVACLGDPVAHLDAHAAEIARLSRAIAAVAGAEARPDARLPSRSPIDLARGEFALAPDRHLPGTVRVTSSRGPRADPLDGALRDHKGLDISAPPGTPVIATADGTVSFAGTVASSEDHLRSLLGTHVLVEHGETGFVTLYAHLSEATVTAGTAVRGGDVLGAVGSTGRSTGPHLHYQVMRGGASLDPLLYIADVVLIADGEAIRYGRSR